MFLLNNLDTKKCQGVLHARDELGNTPLHYAAQHGNIVVAELLMKASTEYSPGEMTAMRNCQGMQPFDLNRDYRAGGGGRRSAARGRT